MKLKPLLTRDSIFSADFVSILGAFHHEHHKIYGHSDEMAEVQIVNLRLVVSSRCQNPAYQKSKSKNP